MALYVSAHFVRRAVKLMFSHIIDPGFDCEKRPDQTWVEYFEGCGPTPQKALSSFLEKVNLRPLVESITDSPEWQEWVKLSRKAEEEIVDALQLILE
jgi:hypothetical protein